MLLMVENGIRGGICHSINKYAKNYDKNEESSYLKCGDVNYLYGLAISKSCL